MTEQPLDPDEQARLEQAQHTLDVLADDPDGLVPNSPEEVDALRPSDDIDRMSYMAARRMWENEELQRKNKELHYIATHDQLTGALNRRGFNELDHSKYQKVIEVDGNKFGIMNKKHSQADGDQLIIDTFECLKACIRDGDEIIRTGGDEFLILLNHDSRGDSNNQHQEDGNDGNDDPQIMAVRKRIEAESNELIKKDYRLKEIGFGLASGGAVRKPGETIADARVRADALMKLHKAEHHQDLNIGQPRK